jgi:prepilin-type N-terminal cleavage/methylation domain-containing protein
MRGGKKTQGFTIIETLIVLAITGGLFAAVALTLSGRQARTQFEQSIQEVKSQIEQTINEVATGFYANTGNFRCNAGGSGPILTAGTTNQGENTGCIFLGKAMQFDMTGTDPEQFKVFTVAGLQRDSAGEEVTTYAASVPTVVSPSNSNTSIPDAAQTGKLLYGLTTHEVYYGTPKTNIGAIAFVSGLAQYSSGSIVSGAQQVNVIPINSTFLNATQRGAAEAINNNFTSSPVNVSNGIKLCFASGATNQSGLITIGSNNRQLSVSLEIKGSRTCS